MRTALELWAVGEPHQAAVHLAQAKTREDVPGMVVQLPAANWTRQAPEASFSLQHMLRRAGYPDELAASAWCAQREESATSSAVGFDPDERTYGVCLHPLRWDYGTMAHEAAHLLANHEHGWNGALRGHSDAEIHGPQFADRYERVIRSSWGDVAGDTFRRHYADAVELVSNYRRRVHGLAGIRAAT